MRSLEEEERTQKGIECGFAGRAWIESIFIAFKVLLSERIVICLRNCFILLIYVKMPEKHQARQRSFTYSVQLDPREETK